MTIFRINDDSLRQVEEQLSIRKARAALKEAMHTIGSEWHRRYLPLHFEPFSATKYRYKPRSPKWVAAKKRIAKARSDVKKGGAVPNVFTGLLEAAMEQRASVRAYPTRVTVTMQGPRYITMRPYKSNQPDKAREITTVIDSEKNTLSKLAGEVLGRHLAANS